jgi:hypothetical protein
MPWHRWHTQPLLQSVIIYTPFKQATHTCTRHSALQSNAAHSLLSIVLSMPKPHTSCVFVIFSCMEVLHTPKNIKTMQTVNFPPPPHYMRRRPTWHRLPTASCARPSQSLCTLNLQHHAHTCTHTCTHLHTHARTCTHMHAHATFCGYRSSCRCMWCMKKPPAVNVSVAHVSLMPQSRHPAASPHTLVVGNNKDLEYPSTHTCRALCRRRHTPIHVHCKTHAYTHTHTHTHTRTHTRTNRSTTASVNCAQLPVPSNQLLPLSHAAMHTSVQQHTRPLVLSTHFAAPQPCTHMCNSIHSHWC